MYRLVAGHRVFGPRNAAEAAEQGMEPQRPPGLTDQQWRALKKSLAFSRVARFVTPADFLLALESEDRPAPASAQVFDPEFERPIRVEPKPTPPEQRRYWSTAIIFLVLVAGALALLAQPELLGRLRDAGQSLFGRTGGPGEAADSAERMPDQAQVETSDESPAEDPAVADTAVPGPSSSRDTSPTPGNVLDRTEDGQVDATAPTDQSPGTVAGEPAAQPDLSDEDPFVADPIEIDEAPAASASQQQPADDVDTLSRATATVPLAGPNSLRTELGLTLREGEDELAIDLVRQADIGEPLSVRLEEVGYSGNQSPWETGRYRISNNGIATFEAGQSRARVNIAMPSDTVRDPDVQANLLVRNIEDAGSQLAMINLVLEDDDQRSFESTLPLDTIGFSMARMTVNERDPAIQIDVLRYNPGNGELEVRYFINGGSATEGEDYFLPGATGLVFEPVQRSARLLIPLVQDSIVEADETFSLELRTDTDSPQANIHRRIEVIIRDDDG
jgi:hypothetical protein